MKSSIDTLLGNRYLDLNSVVLIDEPESALLPTAISQLLDIVAMLAERGIQFFMASHSYFVVKKLFLIAQERGWLMPVISAVDDTWICDDLKRGMPDNPIIAESIRLYEQEVALALK
jgi:predicted ATPase